MESVKFSVALDASVCRLVGSYFPLFLLALQVSTTSKFTVLSERILAEILCLLI